MRRFSISFACAMAVVLSSIAVLAQETIKSVGDEYTLELPGSPWKALSRTDGVHQHTEFVNGDRNDGYLRIRKEVVVADSTPSSLASRDQDLKLRYLSGFVGGKEEAFAGHLNGVTVSYEYTSAGKPMAGRIYYLKADSRTIYTLHFTGMRDKILRLRNQTDAITRSFQLK